MIEQFYKNLLGLQAGWSVESVDQDNENDQVVVKVVYNSETYLCPSCGKTVTLHDMRERTVRHLDSCEYQTFIKIIYPRVNCQLHGVQSVIPPFAAANSRFTTAFENRVIQLCQSSTVQKVAKDLDVNWHVIEGIKNRAYKRGIIKRARQAGKMVRHLAIDETSYQKHHNYSTIISDVDRKNVIAVLDGRDAETVKNWFQTQWIADFSELKSISMDMAPPYIKAVRDIFSNADQLLCFDRFHVSQLFTRAVDTIRRRESEAFSKKGEENPLKYTRFDWLRNSQRTDNRSRSRRAFLELTTMPLQTAKAWKLKEHAAGLWDYTRDSIAHKEWKQLVHKLSRSEIRELKTLAKTINTHLHGILNAIKFRANNAIAEARNSCIQRVKYMACGYRNKIRFHQEILFQFGGLDLAF